MSETPAPYTTGRESATDRYGFNQYDRLILSDWEAENPAVTRDPFSAENRTAKALIFIGILRARIEELTRERDEMVRRWREVKRQRHEAVTENESLYAERDTLRALLVECREMLELDEWSDYGCNICGDGITRCPWCSAIEGEPHDDCRLERILARLTAALPAEAEKSHE